MEKRQLIKLALAAFTVASAAPSAVQATPANEGVDLGSLYAAGCSGCAANKSRSTFSTNCANNRPSNQNNANQNVNYQYTQGCAAPSQRPYDQDPQAQYQNNPNPYQRNNAYQADNYQPRNAQQNYNTSSYGADNNNPYNTYTTDATATTQTSMSESDLMRQLNPQSQAIYQGLDNQGKALALQLASQPSYKDKNLAVKEAQRRSAERNGMMNR